MSLSRMIEYLAIDIGGYLCTNSFHALIAAWLCVSQRSRDGSNALSTILTIDTALYKNLPLISISQLRFDYIHIVQMCHHPNKDILNGC